LVDCKRSEDVSSGLRQKTRRFIRRAEEKYSTSTCTDIKQFTDFYGVYLHGAKADIFSDFAAALYDAQRVIAEKSCRHTDQTVN
jgi:hypothetical protein